MLSGHSASQLVPAARTGWYRCKRCAALATAMRRPALLDGTVPHAGPTLAEELARGRPDAPTIPVVAITEPVVLAGIVAGEDPWQHWPEILASWSPQRLIDELATSGLRGRGGAEFPVAAKWSAAAAGPCRDMVGSGDEGDPGSFCDRVLMERIRTECSLGWRTPHTRLRGTRIRVRAIRIPSGAGETEGSHGRATAAGHLGRNLHGSVPLRVESWRVPVPRRGRGNRADPRAGGTAGCSTPETAPPTSFGLFGAPTAVNNVETLAAVPWIVAHGGEPSPASAELPRPARNWPASTRHLPLGRLRGRAGHAHPTDRRRTRRRAARRPATAFCQVGRRSAAFWPPMSWMCRCSRCPRRVRVALGHGASSRSMIACPGGVAAACLAVCGR
jgi:hypothetical protein